MSAGVEHSPDTARPRTSSYMRGTRIDSEACWQRQLSSLALELTTDKARLFTIDLVSYQGNSKNA